MDAAGPMALGQEGHMARGLERQRSGVQEMGHGVIIAGLQHLPTLTLTPGSQVRRPQAIARQHTFVQAA